MCLKIRPLWCYQNIQIMSISNRLGGGKIAKSFYFSLLSPPGKCLTGAVVPDWCLHPSEMSFYDESGVGLLFCRGEIIKIFNNDVSSRPAESAMHLHHGPRVNNELLSLFRSHLTTSGQTTCKHF